MKKTKALCAALLLLFIVLPPAEPLPAQSTIVLSDELVEELISVTSGELALNNEMMLGAFERNRPESEYTGVFWETEYMLMKLREYGFSDVHMEKFETGGTQWDAVKGRLTVISPFKEKIADHDEVAAMLARNSGNADVTTELVYVPDGGNPESYNGIDVTGKVVISEGSIGSIFRTAVNRFGAAGVVSGNTRYPERHPDMILWNSVPAAQEGREAFGFNIRYPKSVELIDRLKDGETIVVHAEVEVKHYPSKMEVVTGLIPGTDRTDQELMLVAHLFEGIAKQGGNDNYSGVVCILETGRAILELMNKGVIEQPRRSIRFLWVPEISGTRAYIRRFPDETKKMIAGINMDMVGEDLVKTRSYFHVSRTPRSVPSFFNDIVQEFAELTVVMNNDAHNETYGRLRLKITSPNGSQMPFLLNILGIDSGSDHLVFSNGIVRVPTVYLECWPDDFYHSSMDTPDKTDPTQLKRVAFIAAASTIAAAKAAPGDAHTFVSLVEGMGRRRIAESIDRLYAMFAGAGRDELPGLYKKGRVIIEQSYLHEKNMVSTIEQVSDGDRQVMENIQTAVSNLESEKNAALESLANRYRYLCQMNGIRYAEPVLTAEERRMASLVPARTTTDMIEQMDTRLNHGLPRSHPVNQVRYATNELENYIDGRRSILEIAHAVMAELGGPDPEAVAEYYYALAENGSIVLNSR
ncbi:M28 family peptidase [candidate division KSB1 bacterium]